MGSLMAGWDSPVKDPKTVKFQRNKSLTKDEIAAYWRSKKRAEDHGPANANLENMNRGAVSLERSSSLPVTDSKGLLVSNRADSDAEKSNKLNCWWTRSNWAFLNEPPVIAIEGPQKFTPQFDIAHFSNPKIAT